MTDPFRQVQNNEKVRHAVGQISVIILAGGKSQRLGIDKALLELDGEWLLLRLLNALRTLGDDLLVVTNDTERLAKLPGRLIPDVYLNAGPLGGIYSGLLAMRYPQALVVACDMPLLNLELLRYMILLSVDFDIVIPRIGDKVEPLHAVYSKSCLPAIAKALECGERRVISFFPQLRVRYVEQEEIDIFDPQHLSFFNINTLEDLEFARQAL
ncbi:MAG: molybdenum cofactor guanylyltransferase, partial [Chloroflexi bacterium]|nr:molybdenum cofactor guanylyltransferase [Chloroflexota bacterium]